MLRTELPPLLVICFLLLWVQSVDARCVTTINPGDDVSAAMDGAEAAGCTVRFAAGDPVESDRLGHSSADRRFDTDAVSDTFVRLQIEPTEAPEATPQSRVEDCLLGALNPSHVVDDAFRGAVHSDSTRSRIFESCIASPAAAPRVHPVGLIAIAGLWTLVGWAAIGYLKI